MKTLLGITIFAFSLLLLAGYCESKKNPLEEGMHLDYYIRCENGFVYKTLNHRRGTILILNSDGTPLRCGQKHY
jgi:hypothetical protein